MLVKKSVGGQFAKSGEDYKDGDILQILDEGKMDDSGDFGPKMVFQVRLPNEESKNLNFNKTSMNYLIDAYGEETKDWKGKNAKAWVVKQMVSNKMTNVTYLTAPEQMLEGMD